jgi:hypothetical protein
MIPFSRGRYFITANLPDFLLDIQVQEKKLQKMFLSIWLSVDVSLMTTTIPIIILYTGDELPNSLVHIRTIQDKDGLVHHIFTTKEFEYLITEHSNTRM